MSKEPRKAKEPKPPNEPKPPKELRPPKEPKSQARRRALTYGPALDYRTAAGDFDEVQGDNEALYPDYTGLSGNGLGGLVAAVGTESRPTGIRVFTSRVTAESVPSAAGRAVDPPEVVDPTNPRRGDWPGNRPGKDETPPGRRLTAERWVAPPQPTPNPHGFRVSPAVRIIEPGSELAAPTARTPTDSAHAPRRAQLPAIPAPRGTSNVVPPSPPAPPSTHTAVPGGAPSRPAADVDHAGGTPMVVKIGEGVPGAVLGFPDTMPAQRPPSVPPPPRNRPVPPPPPLVDPPGPAAPSAPERGPVAPAAPAVPSEPAAPPRRVHPPAPATRPGRPRSPAPPSGPPVPPPAAPPTPAPPSERTGTTTGLAARPTPSASGPTPSMASATPSSSGPTPSPRTAVGDPDRASFSRNTSLMAAGTLLARLTGFGKVLALAWVLGSGRLADAFNLANNLPNSVYDLLLGGVLSATLIPVFVDELRREDRRESTRAISAVVTTIAALLVVMTAVLWLITPVVIDLLVASAKGPQVDLERHTAIGLLRLFVPQLPLLGGIAVTTALLNARRRFVAPAFSPILCNVVTIGAVIATKYVARQVSLTDFQTDSSAVLVLGLGTTAGYLAQFFAQLPSVFRAGIRLRPVWNPGHPAVRTVLRLSVWTFGAVVTNQLSFYVIQVLADTRGGSVTSFNYAYQFFQLPYAIFAVSIASVIAPDLAQKWSNGLRRAFRARMGSGIRLTLAILFPAGVGYAIVAQPLLRLALRHGSFSVAQTQLTGDLVAIFAIGLPGFSVYLLLMRAYQSMKDTRSMFWCYCVENGLTVAVGAGLYPFWGVRGLVVGWIGSYSVVAVIAFAHLRARLGGLQGPAVLVTGVRVVIATAVMAGVLEGLDRVLPASDQLVPLFARVAVLIGAGTVVYVMVALWLGVAEVRQVLRRGAKSPA